MPKQVSCDRYIVLKEVAIAPPPKDIKSHLRLGIERSALGDR
ncbi:MULTISPECIES: hypothetical protein [Nostocales]|uniref:Uncharacterized protein n=2 Tax=Nostocales TaxID=1161 RepID=A0ABW8WKD9_9CYAN|nr:hypothetical protein [Tolypothrix bouteillei]